MKGLLEKRVNLILIITAIVLFVIIVALTIFQKSQEEINAVEQVITTVATTTVETTKATETTTDTDVAVKTETVKVTEPATRKVKNSTQNTTAPSEEKETEIPYATAPTQATKASYQSQWDAGYLLALDYPDKSYSCRHIELTDESREKIERVCMGEFSVGGFTGAALIAQSIKNAMVYYGTEDVDVIISRHQLSSNNSATPSQTVKDAVIYIFDMDKNAVQHRILYMYNPVAAGKPSVFHETKEYVCTYKNVRFFDQ